MELAHGAYTDTNLAFWEIHNLLTDNYAALGRVNGWDCCRFENWRYRIHSARLRENPAFLSTLAHVWRDRSGEVIGVAIRSEDARDDIHVISRVGHKSVEREIYGWVDREWSRGREQVVTFCGATDVERRALLSELGYRCEGEAGYTRKYDLDQVRLDYALEAGYTVQDVLVDRDVTERARAIGMGFNPDLVLDDGYLFRWDSTRGAPGYRPRLELSVVCPDGRHAAGCLGWIDVHNRVGDVEPVATHPDYRRRGFATAMITECFKRMKALGLETVYIGSAAEPNPSNRLYESLGPADKWVDERWTKS